MSNLVALCSCNKRLPSIFSMQIISSSKVYLFFFVFLFWLLTKRSCILKQMTCFHISVATDMERWITGWVAQNGELVTAFVFKTWSWTCNKEKMDFKLIRCLSHIIIYIQETPFEKCLLKYSEKLFKAHKYTNLTTFLLTKGSSPDFTSSIKPI